MAVVFMAWVAILRAGDTAFPPGHAASSPEMAGSRSRRASSPCSRRHHPRRHLCGIFTPTEAAAVAALYALIVAGCVYREMGWRRLLRRSAAPSSIPR